MKTISGNNQKVSNGNQDVTPNSEHLNTCIARSVETFANAASY